MSAVGELPGLTRLSLADSSLFGTKDENDFGNHYCNEWELLHREAMNRVWPKLTGDTSASHEPQR